jgi:hypothetical protein
MFCYSGSQATAVPMSGSNDAQLFAQLRTLRIIQLNGLARSTDRSISPFRAGAILTKRATIFMRFRELWSRTPIR